MKISIIGGDDRQKYISDILASRGYMVSVFALPEKWDGLEAVGVSRAQTLKAALHGADAVILPFPLSPDGITLNCAAAESLRLFDVFREISESGCPRVFAGAVKERSLGIAASFGIRITDYGGIEEIALKNAVPTAEGAVEIAMRELNVTVRDSACTVVGYGRCGSVLSRLLLAMGARVRAVARSGRDRAKMYNDGVEGCGFTELLAVASDSDVIFNTVPARVFDCDLLARLPRGTLIIELASAPGGVDRECAASYGIRVIHAASLPGKYAPASAAAIICDAIIPTLCLPDAEE